MCFIAEDTHYVFVEGILSTSLQRTNTIYIFCMTLQKQYSVHTVYVTAKRLIKTSLLRLCFALIISKESVQTTALKFLDAMRFHCQL